MIGYWKPDSRTKSGMKFGVYEHWKARFDQSIVVANVDDLKKNDTHIRVKFPLYSSLSDASMPKPPMALADGSLPSGVVPGSSDPTGKAHSKEVQQPVRDWLEGDDRREGPIEDLQIEDRDHKRSKIDSRNRDSTNSDLLDAEEEQSAAKARSARIKPAARGGGQPAKVDDDIEIIVKPNGVTHGKRGRPKGLRWADNPHWSKPGPKPKAGSSNPKRKRAHAK